ncbi:MAG: 2-C-methyl-D-erythritol 2,4-cyclodiphosphate synthase [Clostridia bacterium]|nr:2-C-methyl-D-erythritol 2,4-cyclodiphosphate synthase [Clostridia bacterium]MBQ7913669.1 2-C-methyl-D-erythritol 2,4-cyclodiphosphate synthase [Clostridia bacterium]
MRKSVCAVICAAGKGLRAGFEKNKLLIRADGISVLERTVQAFYFDGIDEIIVTYSPDDLKEMQAALSGFDNVKFIQGGDTRTASVYNALQAVESEIVLIHDGARPFVSRKVIEGCVQSVLAFGSGICAIPCVDTMGVKGTTGELIRVPDRNLLVRIQTPQGFYTQEILGAYEKAVKKGKLYNVSYTDKDGNERQQTVQTRTAAQYTDDSSVYNDFVKFPHLCEGAEENIKLTYKADFARLRNVNGAARCGFGIDTHAFGKPQNYIVLAGVKIPSASGLIAHSDGDVLAHAVMDALLSAAGLKDIGHYFPDTDEKWKGASSIKMLSQVVALVGEQGYRAQNISVAIQAERPRLAKYIDEMKKALAVALGVGENCVGISAGTNEGLGYVGEGKGITVSAYVLLAARQ